MKRKRRIFSDKCKAKVAIEADKISGSGSLTIDSIPSDARFGF